MSRKKLDIPKFVLFDANIRGKGGHYLEYAAMILQEAEKQGMAPVLVAGKSFQAIDLPVQAQVVTTLEIDIWGKRDFGAKEDGKTLTKEDKKWLSLKYSKHGLIWAAANNIEELAYYSSSAPLLLSQIGKIKFIKKVQNEMGVLSTCNILGDPDDWTSVERAMYYRDFRHRLKCLIGRNKVDFFTEYVKDEKTENGLGQLENKASQLYLVTRGIVNAFKQIEADSQTHIFFPTVSDIELKALSSALSTGDIPKDANYHLLFRRNAYQGYAGSFSDQEWFVHSFRTAMAYFSTVFSDKKLRLYTDTEQLTVQYNRFEISPFITLPVPVDIQNRLGIHQNNVVVSSDLRCKKHLRFCYIGDARKEKGFHLLPKLIKKLDTLGHHFEFVIQVYYTPDYPEAECLAAEAELRAMRLENIQSRFIEGALDSSEYLQIVLESDFVLGIYARENYISRSSGIFTEALAAGIGMIIPSGTWMSSIASQITREIFAEIDGKGYYLEKKLKLNEFFYYQNIDGGIYEPVSQNDNLILIHRSKLLCHELYINRMAKTIVLRIELSENNTQSFIKIDYSFTCDANEIKGCDIIGGNTNTEYSLVLTIPSGAKNLWFAIYTGYEEITLWLKKVDVIQTELLIDVSTNASLIYNDEHDISIVDSIFKKLSTYCSFLYENSEIMYYPECMKSERDSLIEFFSAKTLLNKMFAPVQGEVSASRFCGRDW